MKLSEIYTDKRLATEEECISHLEAIRWPDGVACPQCGNKSISSFQTTGKSGKVRHLYQCLGKTCRYQFSPTTGTIFHDSHLPLTKWFSAMALIGESKTPMSANQLRLALGVQYKTAAHVLDRVRQALTSGDLELGELSAASTKAASASAEGGLSLIVSAAEKPAGTRPSRHRTSTSAFNSREESSDPPNQIKSYDTSISPTAADNMLSMFVFLAQMTVKPPLFFVNYLIDKVFT